MIIIDKIQIHNFNSIEDVELKFKQGVHLIIGYNNDVEFTNSNGSGKSSIIEALVYALYGKSLKSNHQRYNTNDTFVKVDLFIDKDFYEIKRYYKHFEFGNKLEIFKNGEVLSFHTQKTAQSVLQNLIKMPFEHFVSSVVIIQGFPIKLLNLTPTKRKEYFINLIDFDFDKVIKKLKSEVLTYEEQKEIIVEEKNKVEKEYYNIEGRLNVFFEFESEFNEDKLIKLQSQYKNLSKFRDNLLTNIKSLKLELREREVEYLTKINTYKYELDKINELLNTSICPMCYSTINVDKYLNRKVELEKLIDQLNTEYNNNEYNEKIKKLEDNLNKVEKNLSEIYAELKQEINKQKVSIEKKDKLNNLINKKEELEVHINNLEDKLINIEDEINRRKTLTSLLSPSGDIRTIVLSNYVDLFNQILKQNLERLEEDIFYFKLTDKGIEVEGIDYNSLSGGERKRKDIIVQISFSDFLQVLSNADFNIRIYDEIFDTLDDKNILTVISFLLDVYYDKSFYIISHNENLKSLFSEVIVIEKDNGISKIKEN